jgi:cysteinyl-tRNA synthetase
MLRIHDTMAGKKKDFTPVREGKVGMYFCGLTVQSEPHVGHMRVALVADVFKRYLTFKGYDVTFCVNFSDIDDKIIEKAIAECVPYTTIAQRNIDKFMEFLGFLGAVKADFYPRATEHIPEIIALVQRLIERSVAYESGGCVYFEVRKWPTYGKLSKRRLDDLLAGASERVETDERKRHPEDFAVWKVAKEGEPSWPSPWGDGRPGWHIECSAMSMKYLGEHFDIHGGGTELIFPHHENEVAQAEAATGKPYVNHWVHHGLVNLTGEKMSKSTGHFRTMAEISSRFPADVVRFYLLSTYYRSEIEFSDERLVEAGAAVERFENLFRTLARVAGPEGEGAQAASPSPAVAEIRGLFLAAMDDDLNTAQAIGHLFDLVRVLNQGVEQGADEAALRADRAILRQLLGILGLLKSVRGDETQVPEDVMILLEERTACRRAKEWARADAIRAEVEKVGYSVEDTPDGPVARRLTK